jgi:hypothetical protein
MTVAATSSHSHAESCPHMVQLYRDGDEIAATVAELFSEGLAAGEPAIAIATDQHLALFAARLRDHGWNPVELQERGMLLLADAEATLSSLLVDGAPSPVKFEEIIGGLVARASEEAGGARVRAYGEMVDLLWQRRDPEGAVTLEELWNDLGTCMEFSLLCGYRIDIFDRTAQVTFLPQVCRTHSRVLSGDNAERIDHAVNTALTETLGRTDAEKVYTLVAAQVRAEAVPPAQLALMWVSAHMPRTAEHVLAAARAHYSASAAA